MRHKNVMYHDFEETEEWILKSLEESGPITLSIITY